MAEVPKGFLPVQISLGLYSERTFADKLIWSPSDYLEHWHLTAKRCIKDCENVAFCDSLSATNAALWIGIYGNKAVKFYNIIAPISNIEVMKHYINLRAGYSDFTGIQSDTSCWEVPTAYVECLANKD